jgi:succinyl-diaminopimelate desuccinylase
VAHADLLPLPSSPVGLEQALAERALALCSIPSVIAHESELADALAVWASHVFDASEVVRVGHSFVLGRREDGRPSVALAGHLDTVPGPPGAPEPRLEGDRLYGLGSSDMKGGLAVMMGLAETLELDALPVNLLLVLYEREEGPYLESGLGPLFQAVPALRRLAFAVALEPTDGVVQVGCVGSLHATLRFRGRAAHAARPWQGLNAIHLAGPFLSELMTRPPHEVERGGFVFREVVSATLAAGGRARNVVPETFEMNVNVRFAPGRTAEEAEAELRSWVGERAEVTVTDRAPAGPVCTDNPLFRKLLRVTGLRAEPKQAWTDVGRFGEFGVDAVNYGPGETAQAHQANESASIEALVNAYQRLRTFLTSPG